jgi:hypothetical protein
LAGTGAAGALALAATLVIVGGRGQPVARARVTPASGVLVAALRIAGTPAVTVGRSPGIASVVSHAMARRMARDLAQASRRSARRWTAA